MVEKYGDEIDFDDGEGITEGDGDCCGDGNGDGCGINENFFTVGLSRVVTLMWRLVT